MSETPVEPLPATAFESLVELALREDFNSADITPEADLTSDWIVPAQSKTRARIIARNQGVIAGLDVARTVFGKLDPGIEFEAQIAEGSQVAPGTLLLCLQGTARALLAGERTALNFLQRLSGIATLTRTYVEAVASTSARITDTRKTTPGLRLLEKYAVRLGGGVNHRFGLYDAVLIKENHASTLGGVGPAVRRAHEAARQHQREEIRILVEACDLDEVRSVLEAGPDRIMLENMAIETMRQAVQLIRQKDPGIEIEATGGIALDNVLQVARTGVDLISIGALTHSAPALDLSMLFAD